jgi:hypothetical protein
MASVTSVSRASPLQRSAMLHHRRRDVPSVDDDPARELRKALLTGQRQRYQTLAGA